MLMMFEYIYNSLTRLPSLCSFKEFFLRCLQNRKLWEVEQKIFGAIGLVTVLSADVLVFSAWMSGK